MSKLGKRSLMDNDQLLEGGGGGAGFRSVSGATEKAIDTAAKRAKKPEKSYFEMTDQEIKDLSPAQRRKYGSDVTFKNGGATSVSKRADGCCVKGKTRGKVL